MNPSWFLIQESKKLKSMQWEMPYSHQPLLINQNFLLVRLRRWEEIAQQVGEFCDHCIQQVHITKLKVTLMHFLTHLRLISLLPWSKKVQEEEGCIFPICRLLKKRISNMSPLFSLLLFSLVIPSANALLLWPREKISHFSRVGKNGGNGLFSKLWIRKCKNTLKSFLCLYIFGLTSFWHFLY